MKKIALFCFFALMGMTTITVQEYKVITSVESIVPSGLRRSRIIDANTDRDFKEFSLPVISLKDKTKKHKKARKTGLSIFIYLSLLR